MLRGLYTAYTGMRTQQDKLDVISNNLANVNTTGFKKDGVIIKSFEEVLAMKINDPESNNTKSIGKMTLGARVDTTYTNYEQGSFKETGNPFNIALDGSGMIALGKYDDTGNIVTHFTRDGSFSLNPNSELVTSDGYFVIGNNGPITMKSDSIINENGQVISGNKVVDQIKTVDFTDFNMLKKLGSGVFANREESNIINYEGKTIQGFVESSNVNSINEMINMINVMRTYESNQKVMTTYDETLAKAVNDVGRV